MNRIPQFMEPERSYQPSKQPLIQPHRKRDERKAQFAFV